MAKFCGNCGHRTSERDPGWCPGCGLDSAWFDDVGDTRPKGVTGGGRIVRGDALDVAKLRRVTTGTIWDKPLGGGIPIGACLLVWGRSGAGKTTLALKLSSKLSPLVWVSLEMPEDLVVEYLQKHKIDPASVWITRDRDWRSVALRARPRAVVLDSVSVFRGGAGDEMAAAYEWAHEHRVTVIAICHATKSGDSKGSSEIGHQSDAALVVRAKGKGRVTMHAPTKNRFALTGVLAPIGIGSIG